MKKFMQNLLITFALVVLINSVFNSLVFGMTEYERFDLQLFPVILIIRLLLIFIGKFQSSWPVLDNLLELLMVLAVVLGVGWLMKWYDKSYLGFVVIIIIIVYAGAYAVGIGRAKRDADFINEQIKQRRRQTKKD